MAEVNPIQRIHSKLQTLLREHQAVQKENSRLREELTFLKAEHARQQESIDSLKQQVSALKYMSGEMNDTDKKEFEKKINSYVREIDRCIALLSQ